MADMIGQHQPNGSSHQRAEDQVSRDYRKRNPVQRNDPYDALDEEIPLLLPAAGIGLITLGHKGHDEAGNDEEHVHNP